MRTYRMATGFLARGTTGRNLIALILDVHMPGRSVFEVLEALGGHHYAPPVLLISAPGRYSHGRDARSRTAPP